MSNISIKKQTAHVYAHTTAIILGILLLVSCGDFRDPSKSKKPQYLFSLSLGTLPGEYKHWNRAMNSSTKDVLLMDKGVFYFANGDRLLILSSNGYLIQYIANDTPGIDDNEDHIYGDLPYSPYPLVRVNNLAVDNQGRLLFTNTIAASSGERFLDSAGGFGDITTLLAYSDSKITQNVVKESQEQYFSSIVSLYTRKSNEIVLVSQNQSLSYEVNIIGKEGKHKKRIVFPYGYYPQYGSEKDENISGIIKTLVPSINKDYFYVQYEYYKQVYDMYGKSISQIQSLGSRIFVVNTNTGKYERYIEVPEDPAYPNSFTLQKILKNGSLVLVNYVDDEALETNSNVFAPRILILNSQGRIKKDYLLELPPVNFFKLDFTLDKVGNIAAYFLLKDRVEVYQWKK